MSRTQAQLDKIKEIAVKLNIQWQWLDAIINYETAGTYRTDIPNPIATNGARGLIQVIDSTAYDIWGVDSARLSVQYSSFDSYMDNVVYTYFKRYAPFSKKESLYLAVFFPALRNKPLDTPLPSYVISEPGQAKGIYTIGDYCKKVDAAYNRVGTVVAGSSLAVLGVIGLFLLLK